MNTLSFKRQPRSSAFTLIELLVVIAILAIFAAMIVPAFKTAQDKVRAREHSEVVSSTRPLPRPAKADDGAPVMPVTYVTDDAGVLPADVAREINEQCAAWDRSTGAQLLVYVAESLPDGTTIDQVGQELFERWRPGEKGKNTGVILAVYTVSRKARIQTGYGMEPTLPDVTCKRIITSMAQHTKNNRNDWVAAVRTGVNEITAHAQLVSREEYDAQHASAARVVLIVLGIAGGIVVVAVLLGAIFGRRSRGYGRYRSSGSGGSLSGFFLGGSGGGSGSSRSSDSSDSSSSSYSSGGGYSGGGGASGNL